MTGQTRLIDEFDGIARLALHDIRQCFSDTATEKNVERAKLGFQAFTKATSRMNAETTRVAVALKAGKVLNIPVDDQRQLWRQIAGASSGPGRTKRRIKEIGKK